MIETDKKQKQSRISRQIGLQILFWIIIAGLNSGSIIYYLPINITLIATVFIISFQIFAFYMNAYVLFPRFFSLKNNLKFILIFALFVFSVSICQTTLDYFTLQKFIIKHSSFGGLPPVVIFWRAFFWLTFINMISTVYMMQNRIRKQAEQTQQISADKVQAELKLLKAQINPHFIFNTLNNIYSLAYMKSDKTPESVLKLSQMLRYVIEDCSQEKVPLKSEIEYIKNYIAFQLMKTPDKQNVAFDYSQTDTEIFIAPMLFMPFIENSFKYSKIDETENAFIRIELRNDKDEITFNICNSIPCMGAHSSGAGTGIENVKKRLGILFPERYSLQIKQNDNEFHVTLIVKNK